MDDFFTIIGGMGTEATETFIHILNERTPAHRDQDYLNYILVNHSTVPDRTDYILDHRKPNPLTPLAVDIKQQSQLKPAFFAIPCNTAHYFFDDLQALTDIPILNMPHETIKAIKTEVPHARKVGLIATKGTLHDGIYDKEIIDAGYELFKPTEEIADQTMTLIYDDVKAKNKVDGDLYHQILEEMVDGFGCDIVVLGCTELSVAQQRAGSLNYPVIDAQAVLADRCIELAQQLRKQKKSPTN